jgi:hypothetical protein
MSVVIMIKKPAKSVVYCMGHSATAAEQIKQMGLSPARSMVWNAYLFCHCNSASIQVSSFPRVFNLLTVETAEGLITADAFCCCKLEQTSLQS